MDMKYQDPTRYYIVRAEQGGGQHLLGIVDATFCHRVLSRHTIVHPLAPGHMPGNMLFYGATKAALLALCYSTIVSAGAAESQAIIATDFESAVDMNLCSELDGGYGPGRVVYDTIDCTCISETAFNATCLRLRPNEREHYRRGYARDCDPRDKTVQCLPTHDSSLKVNDCCCLRTPKRLGSLPPHDADGIACSGGIRFGTGIGRDPMFKSSVAVWSEIIVSTQKGMEGCYVQDSSTGKHMSAYYPCINTGKFGSVLDLPGRSTYQACIEADDYTPDRINFLWFLSSPVGHGRRDGATVPLLSGESIIYDHSLASPNWKGEIILRDENGEEVTRFGKPAA